MLGNFKLLQMTFLISGQNFKYLKNENLVTQKIEKSLNIVEG